MKAKEAVRREEEESQNNKWVPADIPVPAPPIRKVRNHLIPFSVCLPLTLSLSLFSLTLSSSSIYLYLQVLRRSIGSHPANCLSDRHKECSNIWIDGFVAR